MDQLPRVLFVDDEPNILQSFQRHLRGFFEADVALSASAALEKLDTGDHYDIIVSDMNMPRMTGGKFLAEVRQRFPYSIRIALTGDVEQQTAIDAINEGDVYRFLTKPCSAEEITEVLREAFSVYQRNKLERELFQETLGGSVRLLTDVLKYTAPSTFSQGSSLKQRLRGIGQRLGWESFWEQELAAMLHPIGRIALPPALLIKLEQQEPLTQDEQDLIAQGPEVAERLIEHIPRLARVANLVRYCRKNFDGSGPPSDKVKGQKIPIEARLLRILVDLDRAEREGLSFEDGLQRLADTKGVYDPALIKEVDAFEQWLREEEAKRWRLLERELSAEELFEGLLTKAPIETLDGLELVAENTELDATHLERVRNYGKAVGVKEPILVEGNFRITLSDEELADEVSKSAAE